MTSYADLLKNAMAGGSYDEKQQALIKQKQANYQDFIDHGPAVYKQGAGLEYDPLNPNDLKQQGQSGLSGIVNDPQYKNAQLDDLRALEQQAKTGMSAQDEADAAKINGDVGRANAGRVGAIQQNMQARGMGGSGLDMVAQMQSAQAAADREATAALERGGQAADRRMAAGNQRAALAGNMQQSEYNQKAAAAQANDAISRFNTTNSVNAQVTGQVGLNAAHTANFNRANTTADNTSQAGYTYAKDKLGAANGGVQSSYDFNADQDNKALLAKQQADAKKKGQMGAVLGVAGGIAGGVMGSAAGPMGTMAGASVGSSLGSSVGQAFAHGGKVQGPEVVPGDDPANDIATVQVSPGEVVVPKSVAQDPNAAAQFVAKQNGMDPMILDHLAKSNPELVAQYRSRMQGAETDQDNAKTAQMIGGYGSIAGNLLTDYNNSQKKDPILNNRMEDLGKAPTVVASARPKYDGSMIDKITGQGVSEADKKMAEIKQQMMQDYTTKHTDDTDAEKVRQFNVGSDEKAKEFGMTHDEKSREFGITNDDNKSKNSETSRHNRATEGNEVTKLANEADAKANSLVAKAAMEKVPSADQSKAASFASRIKQAEDVFTKLGAEKYDRSDATSGIGAMLPNAMQSSQSQQQEQAERNFVNSVLRRESGAAISPSEFSSAELQYFPRTGDSPEVIKQKTANRQQVFNNLKAESANAYDRVEKVGTDTPVTKVVGGKTYKKVQGGWEEQ